MCGRYTLTTPLDELVESFGVSEVVLEEWHPRFNVAPGQEAPVLVAGKRGLRLGLLTWGRGAAGGGRSRINVRSESLGRVSAYREATKARRCVIPADGFYEWMPRAPDESAQEPLDLFASRGGTAPPSARSDARLGRASPRGRPGRTPYWFHRPDRRVFGLAGLWEPATPDAPSSFAILTANANRLVAGVHDRMPVVLSPAEGRRWLERDADLEGLRTLLAPAADGFLEAWPVTPAVGSAAFDDPSCLDPTGPARTVSSED